MADVVVFYSSEDFATVQRLVRDLESRGITVWWDRDISHGQWGRAAEQALATSNCAVAVWSHAAHSRQSSIHNEVAYASRHHIPLVHVILDDTALPIEVAAEPATILRSWSESRDSAVMEALVTRIHAAKSSLRASSVARPEKVPLGSTELKLPAFVRSVSSHETLVPPRLALLAIALHPSNEPVLVSAYDLETAEDVDRTDIQQRLGELRKRNTPIFLDSGNYEAYRKGALSDPNSGIVATVINPWSQSRYHHTVTTSPAYDGAFSYDNAYPPAKMQEHLHGLIGQYKIDSSLTPQRPVIPIVHAPVGSGRKRDYSTLPGLIGSLLDKIDAPIIAVAERELGDGIVQRARTIQSIRSTLSSKPGYRILHILGTGNLLSATVYAAAGADTFDGLEWCRTVADHDTGHLFHPQHFDFFAQQAKVSEFQEVREYISDGKRDYNLRLLVHNLDFCHKWIDELRFRIKQRNIAPMIDGFLPGAAHKLMTELPGLL